MNIVLPPGQFINEMPRYEDGDTYESILQKAENPYQVPTT